MVFTFPSAIDNDSFNDYMSKCDIRLGVASSVCRAGHRVDCCVPSVPAVCPSTQCHPYRILSDASPQHQY
jgi:hypothetical protein